MKLMTTKWTTALAAFAALALFGAAPAWAGSNPANDVDALTITVTPNVDRGVDIDAACGQLRRTHAQGVPV